MAIVLRTFSVEPSKSIGLSCLKFLKNASSRQLLSKFILRSLFIDGFNSRSNKMLTRFSIAMLCTDKYKSMKGKFFNKFINNKAFRFNLINVIDSGSLSIFFVFLFAHFIREAR